MPERRDSRTTQHLEHQLETLHDQLDATLDQLNGRNHKRKQKRQALERLGDADTQLAASVLRDAGVRAAEADRRAAGALDTLSTSQRAWRERGGEPSAPAPAPVPHPQGVGAASFGHKISRDAAPVAERPGAGRLQQAVNHGLEAHSKTLHDAHEREEALQARVEQMQRCAVDQAESFATILAQRDAAVAAAAQRHALERRMLAGELWRTEVNPPRPKPARPSARERQARALCEAAAAEQAELQQLGAGWSWEEMKRYEVLHNLRP